MKNPVAIVPEGWVETIKQKLNVEALWQELNLSKTRVIEVGIYLSIGFLAGFLFKKWGKYLFVAVLTLIILAVLHQFEFIQLAINWDKIQGLQKMTTAPDANMLTVYWEWVKANFAIVISFSVGFLVGFKVG